MNDTTPEAPRTEYFRDTASGNLNPQESALQDASDVSIDSLLEFLDKGFNLDTDKDPHHIGSYIVLFPSSEYVGDQNSTEFISVVTVAKVRHLSPQEIRIKKQSCTLGPGRAEEYEVLGTERIRGFQLLSDFHPCDLSGDPAAIKRWRAKWQPFIDKERGLFEARRQRLQEVATRRNKSQEELVGEGVAATLGPILAELKRSQSQLP